MGRVNKLSLFGYVLLGLATVAVLGAAGWLISTGLSLERAYQVEAAKASEQAADRGRVQMRNECGPLPPPAKEKCESEIGDTYRAYRKETRDLEAQRTTALWTAYMGAAALLGMAVSIIGVGLVFITFRATREANEIARETAKRQLRAYLALGECAVRPPAVGKTFKVTLTLKNCGQTPARNIVWESSLQFQPAGKPAPTSGLASDEDPSTSYIGPGAGGHHVLESPKPLAQDIYDQIKSGWAYAYVLGTVEYVDIFDAKHSLSYRYRYDFKDNALSAEPEGNDETEHGLAFR